MAMAVEKRYVEVLLPLKLRKTLTYRLDGEIVPGSWVQVPLRGHPALGIVERVHESAPAGVSLSAIEAVTAVLDKPADSPEELAFWHTIADYYLCTPGEVFKAAYNAGLQRQMLQSDKPKKTKTARRERKTPEADGMSGYPLNPLSERQQAALAQIRQGFAAGKPVLLHGATGSGKTTQLPKMALELKKTDSGDPRECAVKALCQIKEREYFRSLSGEVFIYGLCFRGKDFALLSEEISG